MIRTTRISAFLGGLSMCIACGGAEPPPEAPITAPDAPVAPVTTTPAPTTASAAATAVAPAPPPAPKLTTQVITGSPEGFLATSTLVQGAKDAVLIDAQFTLADGKKAAQAVAASKKNLTLVYVTHWHPDHYFGFVAIKEAFPNAKLVATPDTVADIQKTWAEKVKQWKPLYKDAITDKPLVPEPLEGTSIDLEGTKLEISGPLQGDASNNTYVWIPSSKTVIAGDLVYDGVFPWTAETTPESRKEWALSLEKLQALGPAAVVPGHQKPDKTQDPLNVEFTKTYLKDFDAALAASKKPADLQTKIKSKYPDAALDVILKLGAESAFAKPKPAPKAEAKGAAKAEPKPAPKAEPAKKP